MRNRIIYLALLFFFSSSALGQVPTGGYALKQVSRLEKLPLQPGGLIPYRSGRFWGYADTTGKVVIAPILERQPDFFIFGFGQVFDEPNSGLQKVDHSSKESRLKRHSQYRFVNARGETLKGDDTHAVLLLPDSSLQLVERRRHVAQPGVTWLYREDYGEARIKTEPIEPVKIKFLMVSSLGAERALGYKHQNLPPKANQLAPQLLRGALLDREQRRLTRFAYAKIYPFREGFARFESTGAGYNQWGLMNRNGRELLHHYNGVEGPYNNRILVNRYDEVKQTTYGGIVDTTGRFVAPLESHVVSWLIPGQLIGCYPAAHSGEGRLMSPEGQMLLNGQLFRQIIRLSTDRLLVDCFDGQMGVLSSNLQWIVPCQKQQLIILLDRYRRQDTTVIQVVREGQRGILNLRDGAIIAPIRYEKIYANYYNGAFYSVRRAGKDYVLNRSGKEIIEALPAEEYYEPDKKRQPSTSTPLLAVIRPNTNNGLIGLVDSLGRAHSHWQPSLQPGQRGLQRHVFDDSHQLLPSTQHAFTALPKGWFVRDSLLMSPSGRVYVAPEGTTWRTSMLVGKFYEAAPFEFGVYLTTKGYVTRSGIKLWVN